MWSFFNAKDMCYTRAMNLGFWEKLKKPTIVLAPMADVTDAAFRQMIAKYSKMGKGAEPSPEENGLRRGEGGLVAPERKRGGPDVMWTEFVSADGLCHPDGRKRLMRDLAYTEAERPIVAQLFTAHPEKMREAAALIKELGFDGLDINMGCPDRSVEKQGAGAALIKKPALAREVIRAAMEGAQGIPVSVKTRIGYNKDELETWLPELLAEEPAVVTVHARTRKEMSDVSAHWDRVKRAVLIRNGLSSKTLIFGNGDVVDIDDAKKKAAETGADGVMLGRAIFGNPWLFSSEKKVAQVPIPERLRVLIEHTELFEKIFTREKSFAVMKKHYKAYCEGFSGARELRTKLMETTNSAEVKKHIEDFLSS